MRYIENRTFDCTVFNQNGETAIGGTAEVIAPVDKIRRERVPLPTAQLRDIASTQMGASADKEASE